MNDDIRDRLTTRARLTDSPSTLVSAEEARWLLGRDLPEPSDAVDGLAPWSSWVAGVGGVVGGPVTTWRAVARAVGVSEDTLARRREEARDATKPRFESADEARRWWAGLHRQPEPAPRQPRPAKSTRKAAPVEEPMDVVRSLTRGPR